MKDGFRPRFKLGLETTDELCDKQTRFKENLVHKQGKRIHSGNRGTRESEPDVLLCLFRMGSFGCGWESLGCSGHISAPKTQNQINRG